MAVKLIPIPASIASAELSALGARRYSSSYTAVPNTKLPAEMQKHLAIVYKAISGEDFPMDDSTFAVSAKDKLFYRFYAPKLYRGSVLEDGTATPDLYIRWGNARIGLVTEGESIQPKHKSSDKVAFKFATFNPSGRGEDPALEVKVTIKDGKDSIVYVLPVAVAPQDWKAYDSEHFNTTVENDASALAELLATESSGKSSGSSTTGETTDRKTLLAAVFGSKDEQTRPLEFSCIGYRQVKTSYGTTAILQLKASADEEVRRVYPIASTDFGLWADGKAKDILAHGEPDISESNPATLVMPVGALSMLVLGPQQTKAGAIDLDF